MANAGLPPQSGDLMPTEMRQRRSQDSELYLGPARFQDLRRQLYDTYDHLDSAMSHALHMTASFMDAAREIGLEPEKAQKLYRKLSTLNSNMLCTRESLVSVHLDATRIRMRTDQAITCDGCYPNPFKVSTRPELKTVT